jgi:signal transduction histidine kinase
MGIGLWVSRSIIEHHAGRVWATTHDGPGSTFIFALPPASPSHDQPMEIR